MTATEALHTSFQRYASLSTGEQPEELVELYDDSFLAAGPKGSSAFRNDAAFREWLRQVHDFNVRTGMTSLAPVEIDGVGRLAPGPAADHVSRIVIHPNPMT